MKQKTFVLTTVLFLVSACIPVYSIAAEPLPVTTVEFDAPAVDRVMKYNIVVPADYDESDKRYPVLYLLHGLTSDYTAWARMRVPDYATRYDMIVVMPESLSILMSSPNVL